MRIVALTAPACRAASASVAQCLLPLVNWPLIEYTFELLAVAGVHDVIIFACYHSDVIKNYLRCVRGPLDRARGAAPLAALTPTSAPCPRLRTSFWRNTCVRQCKWARYFSMQVIESKTTLSVGDALREVDRYHLIKSNFILLNGDVVSNIKLNEVLREHRCVTAHARRYCDAVLAPS